MFSSIFSWDYFVWDCFVCFLGTILSGNILLFGTVLSVHHIFELWNVIFSQFWNEIYMNIFCVNLSANEKIQCKLSFSPNLKVVIAHRVPKTGIRIFKLCLKVTASLDAGSWMPEKDFELSAFPGAKVTLVFQIISQNEYTF